jgi:hypothetical protein
MIQTLYYKDYCDPALHFITDPEILQKDEEQIHQHR